IELDAVIDLGGGVGELARIGQNDTHLDGALSVGRPGAKQCERQACNTRCQLFHYSLPYLLRRVVPVAAYPRSGRRAVQRVFMARYRVCAGGTRPARPIARADRTWSRMPRNRTGPWTVIRHRRPSTKRKS